MHDPPLQTFKNARREAKIVLAVWFVAMIWTVGYCYLNGYGHDPDGFLVKHEIAEARPAAIKELRLGMPKWVCWGIFAPALGCSLFTLCFGLFGIRDDPLGVEKEEGTS